MAVVMMGTYPGASAEKYRQTIEGINDEESRPPGLLLHAAVCTDDGVQVFDIWESKEAFEQFLHLRIGPAAERADFPMEQSSYELVTLHNVFIPHPDELCRQGASMLPG